MNEHELKEEINRIIGSEFLIDKFIYDEKAFGNILVLLKSNEDFQLRYIRDRGDLWCEINVLNEWYHLDDLLFIMGIQSNANYSDLLQMISNTLQVIQKNKASLLKVLNEKYLKDTQKKLKSIQKNRLKNLFKNY